MKEIFLRSLSKGNYHLHFRMKSSKVLTECQRMEIFTENHFKKYNRILSIVLFTFSSSPESSVIELMNNNTSSRIWSGNYQTNFNYQTDVSFIFLLFLILASALDWIESFKFFKILIFWILKLMVFVYKVQSQFWVSCWAHNWL